MGELNGRETDLVNEREASYTIEKTSERSSVGLRGQWGEKVNK